MRRIAALVGPWLAPPLTVLAVLLIGRMIERVDLPETPEPPPPPEPSVQAEDLQQLQVRLLDSSGAPAAAARVYLLEPALAVAEADDQGIAHLEYLGGGGPFRLWAWMPGHAPLESGVFAVAPQAGFTFSALLVPELPTGLAEIEAVRRLLLHRLETTQALQGALVTALDETSLGSPALVQISDVDGIVSLHAPVASPLWVNVYAPGLPLDPAWLLANRRLEPGEGTETWLQWQISVATLRIEKLPPGRILDGGRSAPAAALPLMLVPPSGLVEFGPLPPGAYHFEIEGRGFDVDLKAGAQRYEYADELASAAGRSAGPGPDQGQGSSAGTAASRTDRKR
ncbi:MAG TPA: hypothetical protein VGC54_07080 [Planctomycetota bacterium]